MTILRSAGFGFAMTPGHQGLRRDFVCGRKLEAFSHTGMWSYTVAASECGLVKGNLNHSMRTAVALLRIMMTRMTKITFIKCL